MKKLLLICFVIVCLFFQKGYGQCTTGTLLSITDQNAAYTFGAGTTYLPGGIVSTNGNLTFTDVGTLCIAPGATLNLNSNVFSLTAGSHFTINVYGTLSFGTNPTVNGNWDINVFSGGTFNAEGKNFVFSGSIINIVNAGTFKIGKLELTGATATGSINNTSSMTITDDLNFAGKTFNFKNNSSTALLVKTIALSNAAAIATIENYTVMNVSSTLNLNNGTARFWNEGTLAVGQNYNSSSTSFYVNCGTYTGSFNLNSGGKLINTGTFTSGQIEFGGSASRVENYGRFTMTSGINMSGSVFYNEGIMKFTSGTFQGTGTLEGPSDISKKGYFSWPGTSSLNSPHIGPNLYFGGTTAMFNGSQIVTAPVDFNKLESNVTIPTEIACPNPDGTPRTPVPKLTSTCAGVNLLTILPTASGVTYEWWTGSTSTRTTQITSSTTPSVANYTTAGKVYLWTKNVSSGVYSSEGAEVLVSPLSVGGTATTTTPVIPIGSSPAAISLTGQTGTIQWQLSTNNSTFTDIAGATEATLSTAQMGALSATTYYRAVVTSGTCSLAISNVVTITVLQPFVCDAKMYLSQGTTSPYAVGLYDMATSTNPFTYSLIGSVKSIAYNATALNPKDGYLYAIKQFASITDGPLNILLRIGQGGIIQEIGAVTNLPSSGGAFYTAGEIDDVGNYYLKEFALSKNLYKIDLSTPAKCAAPTANPILLDQSCEFPDFSYSVKDKLLYGVLGLASGSYLVGTLTSIDPATGKVTFIGNGGSPTSFGAMYGSSLGSIYGNCNNGGFYEFNASTGARTLISSSPVASVNNGAHCVTAPITFDANLSITKTDGKTQYVPGSTVTYTVVASNAGPFGVMNAKVTDVVPSGIPSANVSYTAVASAGATTSVSGTLTGAINDLVALPVGGTVTYTISVAVPTTYTGNLTNAVTITAPESTNDPNIANNSVTDVDTQCTTPAPVSGGDQADCATIPTVQTLTASATVGVGETLVWYDAATGGNVVSSPTLSNVGTVTYYAQANAGVCYSTTRTPVKLTIYALPTAPTIGIITQPNCTNATGSVALNGLPLTGTWTVTESPGGTSITGLGTNVTFNGLAANKTYTFTVTNELNCTSVVSASVILYAQPAPVSSVSATVTSPITCNGGTATVTLMASGGTSPYTYTFNGITQTGNGVFTGIQAGSDLVYSVTDISNCTPTIGKITVTEPSQLSFTTTSANVTCFGSGNGSITVTVSGGVSPYRFSTDNGVSYTSSYDSPYTISNLGPDTYKIRVKDKNECETPIILP